MKVGFAAKKKKTNKKQKKKDKKNKDGDDTMVDVGPTARPSPELQAMADAPTAKDKQRQRMELKSALKVQVASLKNKRNKLTKLAGNRTERRQLNTQLKGLVQEQVSQKKGKKGKQPEQQQAAAEEMMAE